jgi:hypothetical protein
MVIPFSSDNAHAICINRIIDAFEVQTNIAVAVPTYANGVVTSDCGRKRYSGIYDIRQNLRRRQDV